MKLSVYDRDGKQIGDEIEIDDNRFSLSGGIKEPVEIEIPKDTTVTFVSTSQKFFWTIWTFLFERN